MRTVKQQCFNMENQTESLEESINNIVVDQFEIVEL